MSKSPRLIDLRFSLPVPNEILYDILSDIIVEDLHRRLLEGKPDSTTWNALIVLPHVSRLFRATSIRIYAMVFSLRLGKCGDWLLQRVHGKLKHFKVPRIPPRRVNPFSEEITKHLAELQDVLAGVYDQPPGVLRVYSSLLRSNFLCRGALQLGLRNLDLVPGLLRKINCSFVDSISEVVVPLKPTELASLISMPAVLQYAKNYLTLFLWEHANKIENALFQELIGNSANLLKKYLDIFESEIARQPLVHYAVPFGKVVTRAVLEDSGVVPVLERVMTDRENDPQGLKICAANILDTIRIGYVSVGKSL